MTQPDNFDPTITTGPTFDDLFPMVERQFFVREVPIKRTDPQRRRIFYDVRRDKVYYKNGNDEARQFSHADWLNFVDGHPEAGENVNKIAAALRPYLDTEGSPPTWDTPPETQDDPTAPPPPDDRPRITRGYQIPNEPETISFSELNDRYYRVPFRAIACVIASLAVAIVLGFISHRVEVAVVYFFVLSIVSVLGLLGITWLVHMSSRPKQQ